MIEEVIPVNRQMLGEIYELVDIFPYCQSARLLLLKGLQYNSDVKFENQLKNSAIHIADREVLYNYLRITPAPETENDLVREEIVQNAEVAYDNQQTVIETAKNSEYLISEIEKNTGEHKVQEHDDQLQQAPVHSILISNEPESEESAGVMLLMDEEESSSDEHVFYMDPGFSIPENSGLLELESDENSVILPENDTIGQEQSDIADKNHEKQLQSELIDRFIIANPRIEPSREKSNVQSEDISKPFIEEEGCFVTETLARIYVNQGYYSKAIDIYEKLSLKFPEKSSYFASQIEKVKEYIKK